MMCKRKGCKKNIQFKIFSGFFFFCCSVYLILILWLRPFNIQYQVIVTVTVQQLDSLGGIVAVFECNVGKALAESANTISSQINFLVWSNFAHQFLQIGFSHRLGQIGDADVGHVVTSTESGQTASLGAVLYSYNNNND